MGENDIEEERALEREKRKKEHLRKRKRDGVGREEKRTLALWRLRWFSKKIGY